MNSGLTAQLIESIPWKPLSNHLPGLYYVKKGSVKVGEKVVGPGSVFYLRPNEVAEFDGQVFFADPNELDPKLLQGYLLEHCLSLDSFETATNRKLMMVFSSKPYDEQFFGPFIPQYEQLGIEVEFQCASLQPSSVRLCKGATILCLFVNDRLTKSMARQLSQMGVKLITLRCAGTNNVDLGACKESGIAVTNVPAYGPNSVAEHALALMLALNRKIHLVNERVRIGDLSLNETLLGFEMKAKTVGVVGTGKIGASLAKILVAMDCKVLCYDVVQNKDLSGVEYVSLDELFRRSRIVSLHVPSTKETHHMIDETTLSLMPDGAILINTSRGDLVNTEALIAALKSKKLGGAGLDVYEAEAGQFYADHSSTGLSDDVLARLTTFPNVIITCHQGYFTRDALQTIAQVTFDNVKQVIM